MADVLIPPDIVPSDEEVQLVDDGTEPFAPQFAQTITQRQQYFEPYIKVTQTFRDLRGSDRARMISALDRLQGKYNTLRAAVGYSLRGSFPSTELLSNNTFASGTTGWSGYQAVSTLSVSDRILRTTYNQNNATNGMGFYNSSALATLTQYAPHALQTMILGGRNVAASPLLRLGTSIGGNDIGELTPANIGLQTLGGVPNSVATVYSLVGINGVTGYSAGDYFECPWLSLQRCAQVDDAVNALLYSDQFDNAAWSKQSCTVTANAATAPDGTATADGIVELVATTSHYVVQAFATASAAADYCFVVAVKAGARTWTFVQMDDSSAGASVWFNLATGAVGTTGGAWSNKRSAIVSLGNGWYLCAVVATKPAAKTSVNCVVGGASADGVNSYLGVGGTPAVYIWRGTGSQSSVPKRLALSTLAAVNPNQQSGNAVYLKGLLASINGLLLPGDPFVIGGELKRATAALNSDAAGLGYLQFAPSLFRAPSDSDAVIFGPSMGRFMLADDPKWTNKFGVYADLTLTFRHIYE